MSAFPAMSTAAGEPPQAGPIWYPQNACGFLTCVLIGVMTVDRAARGGADNGLMPAPFNSYGAVQARMFRGAFGAPPTGSRGAGLQRGTVA